MITNFKHFSSYNATFLWQDYKKEKPKTIKRWKGKF